MRPWPVLEFSHLLHMPGKPHKWVVHESWSGKKSMRNEVQHTRKSSSSTSLSSSASCSSSLAACVFDALRLAFPGLPDLLLLLQHQYHDNAVKDATLYKSHMATSYRGGHVQGWLSPCLLRG